MNFCLALLRQVLLAPSPVSNPVSCAGATTYKFDRNWITEIYIKNNPTSDTFNDPVCRKSHSLIKLWQGTRCRVGRRNEVCRQWELLKLALPPRRDVVAGNHSSTHWRPLLMVESPVPWLFGLGRECNEENSYQLFPVLLFCREGFKPVINLLNRALVAVYHLPTGISFSEFYATMINRLLCIFFLILSDVLIKLHTNFVQA